MIIFFLCHAIFSISGESKHYGTPTNPAAHTRVPGGSSSGAAVAVAANLVDFSLGEILFFPSQMSIFCKTSLLPYFSSWIEF